MKKYLLLLLFPLALLASIEDQIRDLESEEQLHRLDIQLNEKFITKLISAKYSQFYDCMNSDKEYYF